MSDYKVHMFDDVATALKKIRKQHKKGKPLVWTGPDRLHHSISAGCPPPSECFSEEGLAYEREHGRGFWDVYTMVAFQLGFHNGYVRSDESNARLIAAQDRQIDLYRNLTQKEKS